MLRNSLIHPLLNSLVIVLLFWLVGLFLFAGDVAQLKAGLAIPVKKADGLVALTGGAQRIATALELLTQNLAPRLLISGVDPGANAEKIVPGNSPARGKLACCITMGTFAEDTIGNARETEAWASRYKMKSIVLVTSNYHMRRAMLEFNQTMRDVIVVPYVVTAENVHMDQWWNNPRTASLLVSEYNKLILAIVKAGLHRIFKS